MEIYGPAGLRSLIRTTLKLTYSGFWGKYAIHELLLSSDPITTCIADELHENEVAGDDILPGKEDGIWRDFVDAAGEGVKVTAGPLLHRGIYLILSL
jgi:ribonuclease Z